MINMRARGAGVPLNGDEEKLLTRAKTMQGVKSVLSDTRSECGELVSGNKRGKRLAETKSADGLSGRGAFAAGCPKAKLKRRSAQREVFDGYEVRAPRRVMKHEVTKKDGEEGASAACGKKFFNISARGPNTETKKKRRNT